MVRAKVALLRYDQVRETASDSTTEQQNEANGSFSQYRQYMSLAEKYTRPALPCLCITHGISGSGKSTVAKKLAGELQCLIIRSDVERKRLFQLKPSEKSAQSLNTNIYTDDISDQTFKRLEKLAQVIVKARWPVIVDATFLHREYRERFYRLSQRLNVPYIILNCSASLSSIEGWLEERSKSGTDASEADFSIAREQLGDQEPLSDEEILKSINIVTDKEWDVGDIARAFINLAK